MFLNREIIVGYTGPLAFRGYPMAYRGRSNSRGRGRGGQSWQRDYQQDNVGYGDYGYQERMNSFYGNKKPSKQEEKPQKPKNKGKAYEERTQQRQDSFREKQGDKVIDALSEDFKKNLLSGFDSIEEVIKAKKFENLKRQVAVPVSTRGVGFATTEIYQSVMATPANQQRLPANVTPFMIYRVHLALVEFKIFENRCRSNLDTNKWYTGREFEQYKQVMTSLTTCLQRVGCLVKSIGRFTFLETAFVPMFPAKIKNRHERLVCTPEVLYLTILRETVEQLSDVGSSAAMRQNFRQKNPIPNAQWGEQDILLNPDEIMPAAYTPEMLSTEVFEVRRWIETAATLKTCKNRWFTTVKVFQDNPGNESIFVSNSSSGLSVRPDGRGLTGDVTRFWSPSIINENLFFDGTYHLGGELASVSIYAYPCYVKRDWENAAYYSDRSYIDIVRVLEM